MKIYRKPTSRGGATAVGLLLALSLILSLAIPAFAAGNTYMPAAGPPVPHIFFGAVTIGGTPAPDGTVVSAWVDGVRRAYDTVAAGRYGFHVSAHDGAVIWFYVADAFAASHPWIPDGTTELDLAIEALVPTVQVDLSMVLQGGARPDPAGWEIPVTIEFFQPGTKVLVDSFNVNTTKVDGRAVARITILPGTYDITVAGETTLMNVRRNVTLDLPHAAVDMGTLLEGNANGDQVINMIDFSILAGSFGRHEGDVDFTKGADFDRNGAINMIDFSLLAGNFGETSPVEVP